MDVTALQATIDTLTAQEQTQQAALTETQTQLAAAKQQLADANIINALEALDAAGMSALNAALTADPQNTNGIQVSGSFPAAGAQAQS